MCTALFLGSDKFLEMLDVGTRSVGQNLRSHMRQRGGDGDGFVDKLHRKRLSLADEPGATVTLKIVELFE